MKRVFLAVLLLLSGAAARAEESAYRSLIGMAESAASDPGPDAGDIPQAVPRRPGARSSPEPRRQPPVLAVSPRAASAWTRLFSTLTPSWKAHPPPSRRPSWRASRFFDLNQLYPDGLRE
ncbi:MAG: hypothetical protein A2V88_11490 [Elusimicrobia bacterium RBG_16_66_12]|nr:MAG: hypothetical protein A2V88_11490 [Elusimicrobia bacterium RBG_16_66_12]